ncbi:MULTISPECIES: methyltransferase domain-containing protein [unclassified Chamaesiphon]|uniref:class I SAM-dependent methyltransferase n=1 Tax=unclassified Chamaesiphon TaxID=2620921 RepID=UPI00286CD169|nr:MULTISPECIES: methyltransferase domain-containing protein [unclassified Chamaesiphon]
MQNYLQLTSDISPYLIDSTAVKLDEHGIFTSHIGEMTVAMKANSEFFGHPVWGPEYFEESHRNETFRSRWQAAVGSLDGKIVVDIGCGPGNFYATVGGSPQVLIGVDVSYEGLKMAKQVGYTPLWADAQDLPLVNGFADVAIATATIHHCDDMAKVLSEAARILRPGGLLMTDLDPQVTAMHFKGLAAFMRKHRFKLYWLTRSPHYLSMEYRKLRIPCEAHNKIPGDGITPALYHQVLDPLGFEFKLYPHNHDLGAEVLEGNMGTLPSRLRMLQKMSGIDSDSPEGAQSIMCIARKPSVGT